MQNDDFMDLNFWPAFTDSMLAVVLILLLVIGAFYVLVIQENQNIASARTCQQSLSEGLDRVYKVKRSGPARTSSRVEFEDPASGRMAMVFEQDPQDKLLLHINFMDFILFGDDASDLSAEGRETLRIVGGRIKDQLHSIVEIQIKGHADPRPSKRFRKSTDRSPSGSNLRLASERANEVFQFLQGVGIDPAANAMSASSYGEFFPIGRRPGEPFNSVELMKENATKEMMQANRRIELLLRYGGAMQGCQADSASPHAK